MSKRTPSVFVKSIGVIGGVLVLLVRPSPYIIEHAYVNGGYVVWQHGISAVTAHIPFSLGDAIKIAFLLFAVYIVIHGWRASLRKRISDAPPGQVHARVVRHIRVFASTVFSLLALAGFAAIWFQFGWGFNYDRAPVEMRLQYHASAVTPTAVAALRARAMREINLLGPRAHAVERRAATEHLRDFTIAELRDAWTPVVRRFGDTWTPHVGLPKPTIADPLLVANGTSGFISPFTLEVQTVSDLLWFEKPFDLAHEWTHVAGFAREDEANYAAALTCIRAKNPVIAYSGWLEIFLTVPPLPKYEKKMFVPDVWHDFYTLRDRNAQRVNSTFAHLSWKAYNLYLESNHIASGVNNYDEMIRLLLAIPLDAQGLPLARSS